MQHTGAVLAVGVTTAIALVRDTGAGLSGGFSTNSTLTRMSHRDDAGPLDMQVKLDPATAYIELLQNDTTEVTVYANVDGGLKLKDSVPSDTTEKLHNDGGTLYWDGSPVGGGGWDGYADTDSIDASVDSPFTIVPTSPLHRVSINSDAACTINLPAAPTDGQVIEIKDRTYNAGSNNITINGNGNDIDSDSPVVLTVSGASIKITFVSANSNWEIG